MGGLKVLTPRLVAAPSGTTPCSPRDCGGAFPERRNGVNQNAIQFGGAPNSPELFTDNIRLSPSTRAAFTWPCLCAGLWARRFPCLSVPFPSLSCPSPSLPLSSSPSLSLSLSLFLYLSLVLLCLCLCPRPLFFSLSPPSVASAFSCTAFLIQIPAGSR